MHHAWQWFHYNFTFSRSHSLQRHKQYSSTLFVWIRLFRLQLHLEYTQKRMMNNILKKKWDNVCSNGRNEKWIYDLIY